MKNRPINSIDPIQTDAAIAMTPSSVDPADFTFYEDYFLDYKSLMPKKAQKKTAASSQPLPRFLPMMPRVDSHDDTLTCRAVGALQIRAVCGTQMLDKSRVKSYIEFDDGLQNFLELSAQISRSPAPSRCYCIASATASGDPAIFEQNLIPNNDETDMVDESFVRSDTVILLGLDKQNSESPETIDEMSTAKVRIAEGHTARIPCRSNFTVTSASRDSEETLITTEWRKNGAQIRANNADSNLIVADDGSLIVAAARLADSGAYSCTMLGDASLSIPSTSTQVVVYVDGEWSPWSEWEGTCPQLSSPLHFSTAVDCTVLSGEVAMTRGSVEAIRRVLPRQRRTRACNNPAPLNDGASCLGADEEFRECRHSCMLDGDWSVWTEWSECKSEANACATRTRLRKCNAPAPANGGEDCHGDAVENRICNDTSNDARLTCKEIGGVLSHRKNTTNLSANSKTKQRHPKVESGPENVSQTGDRLDRRDHLNHKTNRNKMNSGLGSTLNNFHLNSRQIKSSDFEPALGADSSATISAHSPQLFVLASMGCVAFLLVVIALLVGALLCTSAQRRRRASSCGGGASDTKKYTSVVNQYTSVVNPAGDDSSGATCNNGTPPSAAASSASLVANCFDGEKIYFPIATSENDEQSGLRTILLSEKHQRYLLCAGGATSRSSTPAFPPISAASRFFTLASAKSTPAHYVRHTTSSATAGNAAAAAATDYGNGGCFLNRRQLAEWQTSSHNSFNPDPGYGIVDNPSLRGSPRYDTRAVAKLSDDSAHTVNESEAENYATLYDYVISKSSPLVKPCITTVAPSASTTTVGGYGSGGGESSRRDDSGNHSSESEQYLSGGEESASADYRITASSRRAPADARQQPNQQQHYYFVPNATRAQCDAEVEERDVEEKEDVVALTMVAAQVDSECARIELKRSGIGLTIGEFAFAEEHTVFLSASNNVEDRPQLAENETWLSSIVTYGLGRTPTISSTTSSTLSQASTVERATVAGGDDAPPAPMRRPVVLSFEHCASLFPKDNWQFVLYGDLSSSTPDEYDNCRNGTVQNEDSETNPTDGNASNNWHIDLDESCLVENRKRAANYTRGDNNEISTSLQIVPNHNGISTSSVKGLKHNRTSTSRQKDPDQSARGSRTSNWEILCVIGEEDLNTRVYVQMERQRCHVMTEHFGRFLLAGRAKRGNLPAPPKRVHLAVYCSVKRGDEDDEHVVTSIRVYCVPQTQMCVESVRRQESEGALDEQQEDLPDPRGLRNTTASRVRGILLTEAENFPMLARGALCCCLEELGGDYALQPESSQYLEIAEKQHGWCAQNGLHFALNLRKLGAAAHRAASSQNDAPLISGRIVIHQKANPSERQILAFRLDPFQLSPRRQSKSPGSVSQSDGPSDTVSKSDTILSHRFQLNFALKQRLCELLDGVTVVSAVNWMSVAQKLGFDRYVQYFATHPGCSPMSLVLDLWEACVGESERALLNLVQALRALGHLDAISLLEPYLNGRASATIYRVIRQQRQQQFLNYSNRTNGYSIPVDAYGIMSNGNGIMSNRYGISTNGYSISANVNTQLQYCPGARLPYPGVAPPAPPHCNSSNKMTMENTVELGISLPFAPNFPPPPPPALSALPYPA